MSVAQVQFSQVAKVDRTAASQDECSYLPYIGLEHIESGKGRLIEEYQHKPETLLATKFRFTENHILYGKLRPYLNKRLNPKFKGVCSTEILPIITDPDFLDKSYLYFYFGTKIFVDWASLNVSGANLPRLSPTLLEELIIPLPSLKQQKHIVHRLEQADRLRRLRARAVEIGNKYLERVFSEFFGDKVSNTGTWELAELGDTGDIQGGLQISRKRDILPLCVPYLRDANSYRFNVDLSEIKTMRVTQNELDRVKLEKGDLLIVEGHGNIDEIGRVSYWSGEIGSCVHQNHLIRYRATKDVVNPIYMCYFLNSPCGKYYLQSTSNTTSGLNTTSTGVIKECPVILPPMDIQNRFAQIVQKHERVRRMQLEALRQAEALYDTLLAQAFGEA